MAKSIQQKTDRSPAEVARLRELRERYQRERPSIADLEAQGGGVRHSRQGRAVALSG